MSDTQPVMARRAAAAQATLDSTRGRAWKPGTNDCARMVGLHLRRLGYVLKMPRAGSYRTIDGGKRALAKLGFASLDEALDSLGLPRIPPAAALVGDVVKLKGDGELGALQVLLGNGRSVGFHEDLEGGEVLHPLEIEIAWRADPK